MLNSEMEAPPTWRWFGFLNKIWIRGLDEKPKPQAKTSSASNDYEEGVKNASTVFLNILDSFLKNKLQEEWKGWEILKNPTKAGWLLHSCLEVATHTPARTSNVVEAPFPITDLHQAKQWHRWIAHSGVISFASRIC
jgi:hypothetical protein